MVKSLIFSLISMCALFTGYAESDLDRAFEAYSKGAYRLFNEKFISPCLTPNQDLEIPVPKSFHLLFLDRVCPAKRQIIKDEQFVITTTIIDYSEVDLGKVDPEYLYEHYLESYEEPEYELLSGHFTSIRDEFKPDFSVMSSYLNGKQELLSIKIFLFYDNKIITTSLEIKLECFFEGLIEYDDLLVDGENIFDFFNSVCRQIQDDFFKTEEVEAYLN